ncbi:ABC transporter substrate-binding protein [Variovorax sp. GT1P44]|uniref:ABC transporter substrate-binding protein n=1 Tax=Variovorax sp. GT1P44 TaxID=3443742 RepID=UPI003F489897
MFLHRSASTVDLAPALPATRRQAKLPATLRGGVLAVCAAAVLALGLSTEALAQAGKPERGGTVIAAVDPAAISTLNTHLTSLTSSLFMADVWADGLMSYDRTGKRIPRLATDWQVSEDGKTYVFNLRKGVKWSDGQPFTAEDVVFTLNNFAKFNTYLGKLVPLIDKAEAPDANTFRLVLKQPLTATLDLFDKEVFPLMPKHVYDGTDVATNPANRAPVGLGPFKFQSWESGRSITFVRNPNYWDQPKPYLDSVVFALIPNAQQRLNAISREEVHWFRPEAAQIASARQAEKGGKFKVIEIENNAPERAVVDFNMRRAPLDNVKVRQALFQAIDRERVVADAYQGLAFTAKNAIPVQFKQLFDPSVDYDKLYPHDVKKAGALLDEAGLPLKDGKRFTVEITYVAKPPYDSVAKIVQSYWSAIGVDVKLAGLEPQIWTDKVYKQHDFDASVISLTGRTNPVLGVDRAHVCNTGSVPFANPSGYCNPEFDKIAAEAAAAPLDKQRALYKKYAEVVARDLNQLTLTSSRMYEVASTRLQGLDEQFNFSFNTHPNWAEAWLPKGRK